jgi:hypothetical protein
VARLIVHRIISGILGTLVGLAGCVASIYGSMGFDELHNGDVPLWETLIALLVMWTLALGGLYLAFRFLKFAFARPRPTESYRR